MMQIIKVFISFFIICLAEVVAVDKIFLKSGDVLNMKVEDIDSEKIYLSDNLNRIVLPVEYVDHIEYENAQVINLDDEEEQGDNDDDFEQQGNWQISHFTADRVYLWNQQAGTTRWVAKDKIKSGLLDNLFSDLWGLFVLAGVYSPTGSLADFIQPGFQVGLTASHKKAFDFAFMKLFFELEFAFGEYTNKSFDQGIRTYHFLPQVNLPFFSNEYGRVYLSGGVGAAFLHTFTALAAESDFTALVSIGPGAEVFVLPYLGLRVKAEYRSYLQKSTARNLNGFLIAGSIGYYFLD